VRVTGSVYSFIMIKDNQTKAVIREKHVSGKTKTVEAEHIAMIREVGSITLSRGFNSIRVETGVEMPWPCVPGDLSSIKDGLTQCRKLVEAKLEKRSADMDKLLDELKD
jgi:hypothetical protein